MAVNRHSYIGIDIGGTNLRGALVSDEGLILHRFRLPSAIADGRNAFFDRLLGSILDLRLLAESVDAPVRALGVGVPGLIDRSGVVHASVNMKPLNSVNLRVMLEDAVQLPVRCANDANLIAVGEHTSGAGQGFSSLLMVTIGTGLGSGLILNGQLWEGADGFAAEFGHVTVEPDGRFCPCGNHGCLEQYVAAPVVIREGGVAPELVAEQARLGNADALALFTRMGRYLGIALSGLLNTLNLEAILIGGGISASYDLLEPAILSTIQQRTFLQIRQNVVLRRAMLGDDAGLLGAAMLAKQTVVL